MWKYLYGQSINGQLKPIPLQMPSKMVTGSKNEKSVLVAVFVERPRKRGLLSSNGGAGKHYHHHHHHHHLHLHQSRKQGGSSNRRAELLDYSRRLRNSAENTPKHHHQTKPASVASIIQQPINEIMAAQSKRKHEKSPACMGNWTSFLKSLTMPSKGKKKKKTNSTSTNFTATKAKVIMQSFQAHKNKGFFNKFLAAIHKYR
ncbi:hypothetical protein POM88_049723 [Heracleum sosnowskyi]|uniref:Uncharacterized protein n=1 Tax=Heracleum sosnowskyi TaxID=360622 RepID=A0AAD8GWA2_9APIA|nr:hypothetical protein POM88_049723 [Heracleum sosnowskyi]